MPFTPARPAQRNPSNPAQANPSVPGSYTPQNPAQARPPTPAQQNPGPTVHYNPQKPAQRNPSTPVQVAPTPYYPVSRGPVKSAGAPAPISSTVVRAPGLTVTTSNAPPGTAPPTVPWTTGEKVALGVGIAAALGAVGYGIWWLEGPGRSR